MKLKPKICPYCKREFTPNHKLQKYCIYWQGRRYASLRQKRKELFRLNKYEQKLYKEIHGIKLTELEKNIKYGD